MSWFEDDICWCSDSHECSCIKCFRNDKTRKTKTGVFTYASFKGTEYCPHAIWGKMKKEECKDVI